MKSILSLTVSGFKLLFHLIKYLFEDLGCISKTILYILITYSISINALGYGYVDYGITAIACFLYLVIRGIIRYRGHKEKEAMHKAYLQREKESYNKTNLNRGSDI